MCLIYQTNGQAELNAASFELYVQTHSCAQPCMVKPVEDNMSVKVLSHTDHLYPNV